MKYLFIIASMFLIGLSGGNASASTDACPQCQNLPSTRAKLLCMQTCLDEIMSKPNNPPSDNDHRLRPIEDINGGCDDDCQKRRALERFEELQREERERKLREFCWANPLHDFCR